MQAKVRARGATQRLVVTASRLHDGSVVWQTPAGGWSGDVRAAAVIGSDALAEALAAAEAAERRQVVVGPYAVEVAETAAGPVPLSMRERLRVSGPSVLPAEAA